MERYSIEFKGNEYDVVEFDGKCVGLNGENIILCDDALNPTLEDAIYDDDVTAENVDNMIFGFAPIDLIQNGTQEELEKFAISLL